MILAIPLAILLTGATLAAIRWFGLSLPHALLAFTAGFLIAGTGAAPTINHLLTALAHTCSRL